jgi:hypothetical protein
MHDGRPEQLKFDASQGNSAAQSATTMVLGLTTYLRQSGALFLLPIFAQL